VPRTAESFDPTCAVPVIVGVVTVSTPVEIVIVLLVLESVV
jgi:hypothetical protein